MRPVTVLALRLRLSSCSLPLAGCASEASGALAPMRAAGTSNLNLQVRRPGLARQPGLDVTSGAGAVATVRWQWPGPGAACAGARPNQPATWFGALHTPTRRVRPNWCSCAVPAIMVLIVSMYTSALSRHRDLKKEA